MCTEFLQLGLGVVDYCSEYAYVSSGQNLVSDLKSLIKLPFSFLILLPLPKQIHEFQCFIMSATLLFDVDNMEFDMLCIIQTDCSLIPQITTAKCGNRICCVKKNW